MKTIFSLVRTSLLITLFSLSTLMGCEQQGPAEKAGEAIDEAAESVGDSVEEATE